VLAIDPQNRFLFAGNNSGGISVFSISNGTLTAVSGSPFAPGTTPTAIAVHPNGNSIYVEDQASATLSAFSVSSAGALTAITGSASNSITDVGDSMAVNSAGTRLYAPIGTAGLATVPINSDGSLGTASITQPPTGQKLTSVALLSTRNLYATNGNTGVFAYTLDSNGFPATILNSGNAFAAGNNTSQVKIEPSGRFLLVVNTNSNSVSSFAILSDGSLTQVAGSPFSTGTGPADLAFDAGGKFVYVVNSQGSPGISIFALDASAIGKLNGAGSASTGTNPLAAIGTH
jgi:6-phosphogluconolactonase (cycloisomerase 2 family)